MAETQENLTKHGTILPICIQYVVGRQPRRYHVRHPFKRALAHVAASYSYASR